MSKCDGDCLIAEGRGPLYACDGPCAYADSPSSEKGTTDQRREQQTAPIAGASGASPDSLHPSQPAAEGTPRTDAWECWRGSEQTITSAQARTLERELAEAKDNYSGLVRINQEIRWELEAAESRLSALQRGEGKIAGGLEIIGTVKEPQ